MTLLTAILGSAVVTVDGSIVNVALPAIERDLGGGLAAQQWVSNAYLLGAALCALGLGEVVFALIEEPRHGWSSPEIVVALVGGVVSFAAFLAYERRARADARARALLAPELRGRQPRDPLRVRGARDPVLLPHHLSTCSRSRATAPWKAGRRRCL
jgi:hypothetical protein